MPSITPQNAVPDAGAVVNVIVLVETVYDDVGSCTTPPSEMISAFGDPGVTEVELLVRLNVVVDPLKLPDISSSLLYEPMSGGFPI